MTKNHAATAAGMGAATPKTLPRKESALTANKSQGCDTLDCVNDDGERNAFAALQAAYAIRGYVLHRLEDGCLLIERWGYCRTVDTITQAAQFLAQIGVAR